MERRYDNSGVRETRRDFIKKTATTAATLSRDSLLPPAVYGQDRPAGVVLVTDDATSS